MSPSPTPRWGLSWTESIRFAWDDLRGRALVMTLLSAIVAISAAFALVLSHYATAAWSRQQQAQRKTPPERFEIIVDDLANGDLWLTEERIALLRSHPAVKNAFAKVEIGVHVSLGKNSIMASVEGSPPDDSALAPSRMAWGARFDSSEPAEIVLSESLFRKLGGTIKKSRLAPEKAVVEVSRTFDGRRETSQLVCRVRGLVRSHGESKAYLPLRTTISLDQWCAGKSESLDIADESARLANMQFPFATVYVPVERREEFSLLAEELNAAVQGPAPIEFVEHEGEIWSEVVRQDRLPLSTVQRALLTKIATGEEQLLQTRVQQIEQNGRTFSMAGLAPDDLYWRSVPGGQPPLGELLSVGSAAAQDLEVAGGKLPVSRRDGALPALTGVDYLASLNTLAWLTFDPNRCPAVAEQTLVQTNSIGVAWRLDADHPGSVAADAPLCWGVFDLAASQGAGLLKFLDRRSDAERSEVRMSQGLIYETGEAINRTFAGAHCSAVWTTSLRVSHPSNGEPKLATVRGRLLPDELFYHLAGVRAEELEKGAIHCIACGKQFDRQRLRGCRVAGRLLTAVQFLDNDADELWLPASQAALAGLSSQMSGLAWWSNWRDAHPVTDSVVERGVRLRPVASGTPQTYSLLFDGNIAACRSALADDVAKCRLTPCRTVAASLHVNGKQAPVRCAPWPEDTPSKRQRVAILTAARRDSAQRDSGEAFLSVGTDWRLQGPLYRLDDMPLGLAMVDSDTFRRAAFEAARLNGQLPMPGSERWLLQSSDSHHRRRAASRLAAAGLIMRTVSAYRKRQWLKFEVRDAQRADGGVGAGLLTALRMARPTVARVVPALGISAGWRGESLMVKAIGHADPTEQLTSLTHGRWPRGKDAPEVCLPLAMARRLYPQQAPERIVGQTATLHFARVGSAAQGQLTLTLAIVGLIENECAFASLPLTQELALWREGKLSYEADTRRFVPQTQPVRSGGFVRCTVEAVDVEQARKLVASFQRQGYRTRHELDKQDELRRLAWRLSALVVLVTASAALASACTVLLTSWMSLQMRRHEIGILKVHGLGLPSLARIYGAQGAIIGTAAFAMGLAMACGVEPTLRSLLATAFSAENLAQGSLLATLPWWIHAGVWSLVTTLCVAGTVPPTMLANLQPTVKLLRRI